MKKVICAILGIAMLFSMNMTVFAASMPTEDSRLSTEMENAVESDITSLSEAGNANLSDRIALRDMNGTLYAYFVPIVESSLNAVSGYSVVSTIGAPKTLTTAVGNNAASLASAIIRESASADEMIYEFPNAFIKKSSGNYYKICIDGTLDQISNPAEYESNTAEFLATESSQTVATRATITYGQLDNWDSGDFLPITESNGSYYYGGYQGWLTSEGISQFYADRSCGVTAAANMLCYMADNVSGMSDLYTQSGISKAQFNAFQRDVYDYLSPAIWGVPTLDALIDGVEDYATDQGVDLTATRSSASWTETNVRSYIAGGLNKESPVLLLTWNSPIADLSMHWVTITRIYDGGSGVKLVTSNWAEKQTYDFSTWVNGSSLYKGVIYFE